MTPNLRCHHDMTGADVTSTPKQPSPKQRRSESFADHSEEAFAAIVSSDVELDGSAFARPVHEAWPLAPVQATSAKCPSRKEFQMTVAATGVPVLEPAARAPAETQAPTGLVPARGGSVPRVRLLWGVAVLEVIADRAPDRPDVAAVAPEHDLWPAEPGHVLFPALIRAAFGLPEPHARRSAAKTARVPGVADLPREPAQLGEPLTQSETRVLRYLPTHMGVPGIAAELCLSANTVKTHLQHVYRKLGVHSRHEAVQRARAIGLLAASSRRPWNAGPPYRI